MGLASLLRAGACEEVAAAEPVLAAAIPDSLALRLIGDPGFYSHACSQPFTAEAAALIEHLLQNQPAAGLGLRKALQSVAGQLQLVPGDPATLAPELHLYAASCNLEQHPYGARLDLHAGRPGSHPPLPARLLALPAGLFTPAAGATEATAPGSGTAADHAAITPAGAPWPPAWIWGRTASPDALASA